MAQAPTFLERLAGASPAPAPAEGLRRSTRQAQSQLIIKAAQEAKNENDAMLLAEAIMRLMELPPRQPGDVAVLDDLTKLEEPEKAKFNELYPIREKSLKRFLAKRPVQNTSIAAIAELYTISTTPLALLMFGAKRCAMWEAKYGGSLRDIFEISEVPDQCRNTVGSVVEGKTSCWICGMPIYKLSEGLPDKDANGLSPECEHVLPIAQAALFLQLYDKGNTSSPLFALEYAWSHKTCNQTKNDDVYFKTRREDDSAVLDDRGAPVFDEGQVVKLLDKILGSERSDAERKRPQGVPPHDRSSGQPNLYSFKDTLRGWIDRTYPGEGSVVSWKNARITEIRKKYAAITDFIVGTNYTLSPQTYLLAIASAAAAIINRQDDNRRTRTKGPSVRRETLYGKFIIPTDAEIPPAKELEVVTTALGSAPPMTGQPEPPKIGVLEPEEDLTAALQLGLLAVNTSEAIEESSPDAFSSLIAASEKLVSSDAPPETEHILEVVTKVPVLMRLAKPVPDTVTQAPEGSVVSVSSAPAGVGSLLGLVPGNPDNFQSSLEKLANAAVPTKPQPGAPVAASSGAATLPGIWGLNSPLPGRVETPRRARGMVANKQAGTPPNSFAPKTGRGRRRTRRRTRSFLPHKKRRTHHAAIKMSSKRHSLVGKAAKS